MHKLLKKIGYYAQLMRVDKPIGSLLLLWPTLWALWLSSSGRPDTYIAWVFIAGVFVMRSAGCVINDFADRKLDPKVERTKNRPLAAGKVGKYEALSLFVGLCLIALVLVLTLDHKLLFWAVPAAAITIIYPFMKRFIQAPQVVLGLAFSFGIPMAFVAHGKPLDILVWMLFAANFCWIIVYDTLYAMSDREDDLKVGIKSTAILFGAYDRLIVMLLQFAVLGIFALIGIKYAFNFVFYFALGVVLLLFAYQQWLARNRDRLLCFQAFLNNGWVGAVLWFGILLGLNST